MREEQRAEYAMSIRRLGGPGEADSKWPPELHAIVSLPAPMHECDHGHVWAEVQGAAKALMDGAAREKL